MFVLKVYGKQKAFNVFSKPNLIIIWICTTENFKNYTKTHKIFFYLCLQEENSEWLF